MTNFINKTKEIAYAHFKSYQFEDEDIARLTKIGMRDVHSTLETLKLLIKEGDNRDIEALHDTLHALKGLCSQLGNTQIIREIEDLEASFDIDNLINKINLLFFY
jgi:HPt (histidine-containing phosphotransfer) domain-containing protein